MTNILPHFQQNHFYRKHWTIQTKGVPHATVHRCNGGNTRILLGKIVQNNMYIEQKKRKNRSGLSKTSSKHPNFLWQISYVKCLFNINLSKPFNLFGQKTFDALNLSKKIWSCERSFTLIHCKFKRVVLTPRSRFHPFCKRVVLTLRKVVSTPRVVLTQ